MIGMHALFTLSEESLKAASPHALEFGSHIHVAEGKIDGELCRKHHGIGLIERLQRHDLLGPKSLIIHGLHLNAEELRTLHGTKSWLVTNPESNANNQVGLLDLQDTTSTMPRLLLGTDGMSSDMIQSLKSAFLLQQQTYNHKQAGWLGTGQLLANNAALAADVFDDPQRGQLVPGGFADFAVWKYRPQEAFGPLTLLSDLVFGVSQSHVQHTVSHGRWLMRDGVVQTIDQDLLHLQYQQTQPDLWRRFHAQPAETHFLGNLAT
jgi:cytosine/adenosine deaminase-related metal-dependent hydrolase